MNMSGSFTSGKPGEQPANGGGVSSPTRSRTDAPGSVGTGSTSAPGSRVGSSFNAPPITQRMIKCPKCGVDTREVARFCARCHATLRFECPACKHEQRKGGACEKCGVNFAKYITAVVASKKVEADQVHDRIERRTGIIKQVFLLPITGGLSLIKYFFRLSKK
jgi:hypothetical protein